MKYYKDFTKDKDKGNLFNVEYIGIRSDYSIFRARDSC